MNYKVITYSGNVATLPSQGALEFSGKTPKNLAFFIHFKNFLFKESGKTVWYDPAWFWI